MLDDIERNGHRRRKLAGLAASTGQQGVERRRRVWAPDIRQNGRSDVGGDTITECGDGD